MVSLKHIILDKQVLIFLFVGSTSAILDVLGLFILSKVLLVDNYLSVIIAYLLGLAYNYVCHTYLTFNNKMNFNNILKFLSLVIFNYLLTVLLIYIIHDLLGVDLIIAKILTLPAIAISTFSISKYWVYRY
ncbi:GtrA family protein [Rodentibacter haemolyticus]|uniref:GtrA family protein n=1 Tax=Rodentibacter haemolyticus TaxID=2778911 RepID=A0ABX6V4H4_9PAST|nr:GtrA family protein [Rodentibacter haemolyticus]